MKTEITTPYNKSKLITKYNFRIKTILLLTLILQTFDVCINSVTTRPQWKYHAILKWDQGRHIKILKTFRLGRLSNDELNCWRKLSSKLGKTRSSRPKDFWKTSQVSWENTCNEVLYSGFFFVKLNIAGLKLYQNMNKPRMFSIYSVEHLWTAVSDKILFCNYFDKTDFVTVFRPPDSAYDLCVNKCSMSAQWN